MKSTELRLIILREFRELWEKNPDKDAYIVMQDVWNRIVEKTGGKITGEFGTSVLKSLHQDEYLCTVNMEIEGKDTPTTRITGLGLYYLQEYEKEKITRRIAILGAVTGSSGLIVAIIGLTI